MNIYFQLLKVFSLAVILANEFILLKDFPLYSSLQINNYESIFV